MVPARVAPLSPETRPARLVIGSLPTFTARSSCPRGQAPSAQAAVLREGRGDKFRPGGVNMHLETMRCDLVSTRRRIVQRPAATWGQSAARSL